MDIPAEARDADTRSELARILRALRQREASRRLGPPLSLRQIADRTGWSHMAVSFYLNGRRLPSAARFDKLIALLGADAAERAALGAARQRLAAATLITGPARPAGAPPRAPPAAVAGFTGRGEQLAQLSDLAGAERGPTRIALITGVPGVGKTALAVQWAHRAAASFPNGQLYVDMHAHASHAPLSVTDALGVLLTELGADLDGLPDLAARAARYHALLRERSVLVLLDNVGGVQQLRGLLPPPPCVAVVTSRDRLLDVGELGPALRLTLGALPEEDALALLRLMVGERVEREPQAARALAARSAYLPLALRVAAEHAAARPHTPLAELVGELVGGAGGLDEFAVPGDARADLRSVFSWSINRLPAAPRRAFGLLGLVPGFDVDRYGLAALAGVDPVEADELAAALIDAHLVEPRGVARFAMHDLLRAYAAETAATRMSTSDCRSAVGRLLAYYLHATTVAIDFMFPTHRHDRAVAAGHLTAAVAGPELADARAGAAWLGAERINLVRACGHAAGSGWPHETIALALALGRYLEDLHYDDALSVFTAAAAAADQLGEECGPARRAGVWTGLGLAHWRLGDADLAVRQIESAFEANQAAGDNAAASRNLAMLGVILDGQGRYQQAMACHRRGLELARASGVPVREAIARSNLAAAYFRVEEYQTALDLWERARQIAETAGESWPLGTIREGMAAALVELGRHEEALALAMEAVATHQSFAQVVYRLRAQESIGSALRGLGRHAEAVDRLTETLRECREHGNPRPTSLVLNTLGETYNDLGDAERALACHTEAMALADRHGNRAEHARARVGLGDAHETAGDLDQARQHWQQAYDEYAASGLPAADRLRARLSDRS